MVGPAHKTWILTGSLEDFRINVERGFDVIGLKQRRQRQADADSRLLSERMVTAAAVT